MRRRNSKKTSVIKSKRSVSRQRRSKSPAPKKTKSKSRSKTPTRKSIYDEVVHFLNKDRFETLSQNIISFIKRSKAKKINNSEKELLELLDTLLNLFTNSENYVGEDPHKVLNQMKMMSLGTVKTVDRLKK